jgi:hypothetical protein
VGQVNEAEKLFNEALVLFRQLLDRHGETRVLSSMSNVKENIFAGRIIQGGQDVQQA